MKAALTVAVVVTLGCMLDPGVSSQTPPVLNAQIYAGLTITGAVGTVYSIECVTDLAQTNDASAWHCLEFLQLPSNPYLWIDKSAPATGQRFYRASEFAAPMNMVFIPPGTFRMGSTTNEVGHQEREGPQTAVIVSRGFWMGAYEVTQSEYEAVMGANPSFFRGDSNLPADSVPWSGATNYCGLLTVRDRAAGRIASNSVYRLPTEAEWEYACRAWTSSRFSYGDDPSHRNLLNFAWYDGNSGGRTHPVGQKSPNPWGLHDVHGNIEEWCGGWYSDNLPGGITIDPPGPRTGYLRVLRGGSWRTVAMACGSPWRWYSPDGFDPSIGFRIVLAPNQP